MYEYGIGVEKDEGKAFFYYKKAVDIGDVLALSYLSSCYWDGKGTVPDREKAEELSSLFKEKMKSMNS